MAENRVPPYPYREDKKNVTGIDLESVTGQIKSSLWDLAKDSMLSYLSGNEYSEDRLKSFLGDTDLRVPIKFPGDYGIDFDINRWAPDRGRERAGMDPRDDYRITFKKEF